MGPLGTEGEEKNAQKQILNTESLKDWIVEKEEEKVKELAKEIKQEENQVVGKSGRQCQGMQERREF